MGTHSTAVRFRSLRSPSTQRERHWLLWLSRRLANPSQIPRCARFCSLNFAALPRNIRPAKVRLRAYTTTRCPRSAQDDT